MTEDRASERRLLHGFASGAAKTPVLTARQLQVLRLRAQGRSVLEITDDLGIRPQTVKNHLLVIYRRLGVGTLIDALRVMGWLRVP